MSGRAAKIRNVGPKSAAWLRQVGVRSTEDLARIGPVEVYLKVKRAGFRPTLNLLYSMAGALADCHWAELPEAHKHELLQDLDAAESANPIQTRWERQKAASESAFDDGQGMSGGGREDVEEAAARADEADNAVSRFD
jgi:hypothetical protein